jgi:hypothetical protein
MNEDVHTMLIDASARVRPIDMDISAGVRPIDMDISATVRPNDMDISATVRNPIDIDASSSSRGIPMKGS